MDENQFWVRVWGIVGSVVVVLAAMLFATSVKETRSIEAMVKAGADPVRAACAIRKSSTDAVCLTMQPK